MTRGDAKRNDPKPKSGGLGFAVVALGICLYATPCIAQSLKFERKIGVGFRNSQSGWMSFVSFSPDGTIVASDGPTTPDDVSGNLTLWNFGDGRLIKQLPARPIAISRDWKYYATYHGVAEMESGKPVIALGEDANAVYAFSPDSRFVAESIPGQTGNGSRIRVVELASGRQAGALGRHAPFSIAISPDGTTLASGHWGIVALWNMQTGKRLAVLRGFGRYVDGLSFSSDGRLLAASTDAGGLQIWDVLRLSRAATLDFGGGNVSEPQFSPDGRFIAVGVYGTGTAFLIEVGTGKIVDRQKISDLGCGSVAFSPDGHYLITPSTGGLIKWPYDMGGTIRVFSVTSATTR